MSEAQEALVRESVADLARVRAVAAVVDAVQAEIAADLDAIADGTLEPVPEPESGGF